MHWGNILILVLLILIPIIIIFISMDYKRKKKNFTKFADKRFFNYFFSEFSLFHWNLKNVILAIAILFTIIALAKPRWGKEIRNVKKEGLDIVVALDVSKSMDAEDIQPSRIERAKDEISRFIAQLKGDRVALVAFAGESFIQCPLTNDYSALELFLSLIDTDVTTAYGTDIGGALQKSDELFGESNKYKVIILISDGEDLEEEGLNVAKKIAQNGTTIYSIGVGSPDGSVIPVINEDGSSEYAKNEKGEIVFTKLDVELLTQIASSANGKFYPVTPQQSEIFEIFKRISMMEKHKFDSKEFSRYKEQFHYFLIIALILLVIESLITIKKDKIKPRVIEDENE